MNPRYINFILISICVALLGLVVIQVNWVKQSYKLREDRFDQEVSLAMSNTTHRLELDEAENYFKRAGIPNFQNTVSKMYDTMQSCYNVARRTEPRTEGKLQIEWTIGSEGQVEKAEFDKTKTTLKNEALIACVLNGSKTWTFPKPEVKDSVVIITFPIVFSLSKDGQNMTLETGSTD